MEDLTGKQLGPYQVVAPLGEGGMAAVYKAYQPSMERYVALKILPRHLANDPQFVSRFEQEAKVLANLQHPHILPVFDFGQTEGYTYIVMPFLQSGDLTDLLRGQPLPLDQIRHIIDQVGDALDYAHSHGLIHRDVKPSNVLLDERGNCLLTDFGIAKMVAGSAGLTATGAIIGTPAYMSPEQGLGHKLDKQSDIYALGIMLYEMATGRVPYRAETPMAVVVKQINDPLPLPHKLNPDLPDALQQVILKALAKQPEDRYATAGDMVQALKAAIPETAAQTLPADQEATLLSTAGPTLEQPQVTTEKLAAQKSIPPNLIWILAAIMVVIVVVGAVIFYAGGAVTETTEQATFAAEAEPLLYDDFEDPRFEGSFDAEKWELFDESGAGEIAQEEDVLRIFRAGKANSGIGLTALVDDELFSRQAPIFFEADLMVEQPQEGHVYLYWGFVTPSEDYTSCTLGYGYEQVELICNYVYQGEITYTTPEQLIDYGQWPTARIEMEPATMTFTYELDGEVIGSYSPPNAEALKEAGFFLDIGVWGEPAEPLTGYIDAVWIGQLEP